MVVVYKHERALEVLEMLSSSNIVTLDVRLDESLGEDAAAFVIKYTILNDYSEEEQFNIRKAFDVNTNLILKTVKEFSEFIEMMSIDNVKNFLLKFNIVDSTFVVSKSYNGKVIEPEEPKEKDIDSIVNDINIYITNKGIHNVKVNAYEKIPNPNGKRPKYEQMTVENLIELLKGL